MNCVEQLLLLILAVATVSSQQKGKTNDVIKPSENKTVCCSRNSVCPTWFVCSPQKYCQCGDGHNDVIVCNNEKLISAVLNCHCVTYDGESESTFVGSCFYNCASNNFKGRRANTVYHQLPKKTETLINRSACSYFHRKGLLCGDCEDGHSPFVLSYNLSCVECPDGHKNWWKFILVGFLPLTFFYFIALLFNTNVTSSHLHSVVWFSQALSMPAFIRNVLFSINVYNPGLLIDILGFL